MLQIVESPKTDVRRVVSHLFQTVRRLKFQVDFPMAIALRECEFTGQDDDNLTGLSIFTCVPRELLAGISNYELSDANFPLKGDHNLLNLRDIKKVTKIELMVPKTLDSLITTVKNCRTILHTLLPTHPNGFPSPSYWSASNIGSSPWTRIENPSIDWRHPTPPFLPR